MRVSPKSEQMNRECQTDLTQVVLEAGKLCDNGMVRAGEITPLLTNTLKRKNAGQQASVLTVNELLECPA